MPYSFSLFLAVGLGVEVYQTPPALLRRPGDTVQLVCSHGKTDYYVMYWYQKSPGDRALKRIGHTAFKSRFSVKGDGEKSADLHILNPTHPEDSGEYFGAASVYTAMKTVTH
uniref:Immunoglobulin V-set domain-containing protein n=1 Tax=Anabas testudineus TaxID=64144 RepID=A0A3Q1J8S4_ANATE